MFYRVGLNTDMYIYFLVFYFFYYVIIIILNIFFLPMMANKDFHKDEK